MAQSLNNIAVVIASIGRPDALADCVAMLNSQTRRPDRIVFSVTGDKDLPGAEHLEGIEVVVGPKGLPAQRNLGIEQVLADSDVIVFFDDDYIASTRALERLLHFFNTHGDVVGVTGHLLADGIHGPGISTEDALDMVARYDAGDPPLDCAILDDLDGLYGCNMAYRTSAIGNVRFDTNLPLYAWQEDIDFAAALRQASGGRIVKSHVFAGVHRGAKSGRTSGTKLGYSQIANPIYLMRKGTMTGRFGRRLMMRNFIANHVKMLRPEPWVDRWGRVRGNWIGLADWTMRRLSPGRILDMK